MAIKRLNKNDIIRGRIMDQIAEQFGNSVLGLYDKKLRIELIDDEGNVIQFSIAPVVHKDLVDPEECDEYIPTDDKIKMYEDSLKKNAPKETKKKKKTSSKPKKETSAEEVQNIVAAAKDVVEGEFSFEDKVVNKEPAVAPIAVDEQADLDKLMSELGF